ncbi:IS3 family transposase [Ralstonia pseudosolanacearum]|uniref:IS3 family transposase n=1 Tax=Ralstonia pseudosolanacearum TaxID=1310165 RepID=UPI00399D6CAD
MMRHRNPYPAEFRAQLVELVRAGRKPEELAREFEPTAQSIHNWVAQADRDAGRRHDGLTSSEREELTRLRRENRQLKLEREILAKAGGLVRAGDRSGTREGFAFMKANQALPVATMARLLGVSPSGYHAWRQRTPSTRSRGDTALLARIQAIHARSHGIYGAPRIHAELAAQGVHVGRKRVARLMREAGLCGVSRRRWITTTRRSARARPAPDLVQRQFHAAAPNRLWVADATYIPTGEGFLYLAVVLDVFSRRIVGWAMDEHLYTALMLRALDMALLQRQPEDVIHHSDQGCQYTSLAFGKRCQQAGVRHSMGSVGDAYDNAMCESFFATLEWELLARERFSTRAQAQRAVFTFIEGWYNTTRLHSGIGYRSPLRYELLYVEQLALQPRTDPSTTALRGGPHGNIQSTA